MPFLDQHNKPVSFADTLNWSHSDQWDTIICPDILVSRKELLQLLAEKLHTTSNQDGMRKVARCIYSVDRHVTVTVSLLVVISLSHRRKVLQLYVRFPFASDVHAGQQTVGSLSAPQLRAEIAARGSEYKSAKKADLTAHLRGRKAKRAIRYIVVNSPFGTGGICG